jgi:predicted hydrolase (HD superfamily)
VPLTEVLSGVSPNSARSSGRTVASLLEWHLVIGATALVRPTKSVIGLEVSSVRKKMKTKGFAAGVNRDDLYKGAEELGIDLDEHIANVIQAMSGVSDTLGLAGIQASEAASLG